MATRQRKNRVFLDFLFPLSMLAVLMYFAFHAMSGSYGSWALSGMKQTLALLEAEQEILVQDRKTLIDHMKLMKTDGMNRDMLDERARYYLNVANRDDIIIFR
ncbi:MAG: cell division protein [Hyphomicrobiales bacterium]|nr:MAG: cell division protein [Hyphomicrobiales bacterium]